MCKLRKQKGKISLKQKQNQRDYVFQFKKHSKFTNFQPIIADFNIVPHKNKKEIHKYYPSFIKNKDGLIGFAHPLLLQRQNQTLQWPSENITQNEENSMLITMTNLEPGPGVKLCSVCRIKYDQYVYHIETISHNFCLQNSKYQKEIKNLCEKYGNNSQNQIRVQMETLTAYEPSK